MSDVPYKSFLYVLATDPKGRDIIMHIEAEFLTFADFKFYIEHHSSYAGFKYMGKSVRDSTCLLTPNAQYCGFLFSYCSHRMQYVVCTGITYLDDETYQPNIKHLLKHQDLNKNFLFFSAGICNMDDTCEQMLFRRFGATTDEIYYSQDVYMVTYAFQSIDNIKLYYKSLVAKLYNEFRYLEMIFNASDEKSLKRYDYILSILLKSDEERKIAFNEFLNPDETLRKKFTNITLV